MRKAHLGFPEGPHPQAGAPAGSLRRRDPLAVDGRPPSTTGRCSGLTASLASRLLLPNAAGARASRGACGKCLRRVGNSWAANGWDRAQNLHALGAFPAALTGPREVPHGLWGAEPTRGRRPSSQDAGLGECHSELCVSARRAWLRPPFLTRSFQCLYGIFCSLSCCPLKSGCGDCTGLAQTGGVCSRPFPRRRCPERDDLSLNSRWRCNM